MRYIGIVAYDGTAYAGWQYQLEQRTIQGEIETALYKIFKTPIRITGASRTDAGVHAKRQFFQFDYKTHLSNNTIKKALNNFLPRDILIRSIDNDSFHVRYDAIMKEYKYYITMEFSPFKRFFFWYIKNINIEAMEAIIPYLREPKQWALFSFENNPIRFSVDIEYEKLNRTDIVITLKARSFFYKMVRRIVGLIVAAGLGKFTLDELEDVFLKKIPQPKTAPANGLFLENIFYKEVE